MTSPFDLVIACDWSAAKGRKPEPGEDRCWLAWRTREEASPDPEYMPTRLEAEARVLELLLTHKAARALVGFDFAIGYPLAENGQPVLPIGRDLCAMLAGRISDDASGVNNRYEVAQDLNALIRERTGAPHGPFWGRPKELTQLTGLPMGREGPTGVPPFRAVDGLARGVGGARPQSPWKLAGIGSVGSQSLMGLPTIHRLLIDPRLAPRAHLWPFEPAPDRPDRADAITIAEIYPSLFPQRAPTHWYKDARQVSDSRDAMWEMPTLEMPVHERAKSEGWIVGVPG
ncbi:MAG: hypothetical protein KIT54_04705 [Phycisphaeraceae bacterium]|nr:hypothetical protein [Phycisphaeraceae bacterium]